MGSRWTKQTAVRSNDPRFTNRNNNHTVHFSKGLCKICGEPVGRGHDWSACANKWIESQDKERAGTPS